MRLIDGDKYCDFLNTYPLEKAQNNFMSFYREALQYTFECEVEAIPVELYEQVKGERDVAIEQLKSLNIELFEKPYLKAITIEWIYENAGEYFSGLEVLHLYKMIEDWEKENE